MESKITKVNEAMKKKNIKSTEEESIDDHMIRPSIYIKNIHTDKKGEGRQINPRTCDSSGSSTGSFQGEEGWRDGDGRGCPGRRYPRGLKPAPPRVPAPSVSYDFAAPPSPSCSADLAGLSRSDPPFLLCCPSHPRTSSI